MLINIVGGVDNVIVHTGDRQIVPNHPGSSSYRLCELTIASKVVLLL